MCWDEVGVPVSRERFTGNALRLSRALFLTVLLVTVIAIAGCGRAEKAAVETGDSYKLSWRTEPAAPAVGVGTAIVTIESATGDPVDGATVTLEANMNHAGMVPVQAQATSKGNGVYRADMAWTMGGAWYVDVTATLPGGEMIRRRFPVDVR